MKRLKWDQQKQESLCIFLYFIVAAVTVLLLATRSSFLYPCNNWDDANSYFSVGKAILTGNFPIERCLIRRESFFISYMVFVI